MFAQKVKRLKELAAAEGRKLRFGLRTYVIVRETAEEAWAAAQWQYDRMDPEVVQRRLAKLPGTDSEGEKLMLEKFQPGMALPKDARHFELYPGLWAGVGLIRINRPEARNALTTEVRRLLGEHLSAMADDPVIRCIVLTGNDKAFAAGADIKEMQPRLYPDVHKNDFISAHWEVVTTIRKPVIAAVAGFALGGGCELAMMCDIIVAADNAKFGQPEIKLAVTPGMGGSQRLTRAVGKAKAMEMCLTGRMMDAAEAERAGLVSHHADVVNGDRLAGKLLRGHRQDAAERHLVGHRAFEHHRVARVIAHVALEHAAHRDALARPRSFNAEDRSVEATIATSTPVSRRDARGEFLNAGQIDALSAMVGDSFKRMDAVNRITSNASKIVTNAARDLFDQQPALIAPGGNAYTTRRWAACLRDMDYFLRYASYALVADDSTILNERVLNGLDDTYKSLGVPTGPTVRSIALMADMVCEQLSDAGVAVVLECMPRRIAFINATLDGLPDDLVHALSEALAQIETRLADVPMLSSETGTKNAAQPEER